MACVEGRLLVVIALLAGAGPAAAQPRRTAVVVFPFAARTAEQRIYGQSLARAVAKSLETAPGLRPIVATQRPASDEPAPLAAAARALGGELCVAGVIEPDRADHVRLHAVVVNVARRTRQGPPTDVVARLERLDEAAGELARALRPGLEGPAAPPASSPASQAAPALLVFGVDAPVAGAGPDVRVPATRSAYLFVRRRLHLKPVPEARYGFTGVATAAAAAAAAGCRGALMVRVERLTATPGQPPGTDGRVTLRIVAADGRRWRDRAVAVRVQHFYGEPRDRVAQRIVASALERALPELEEVLGPAR
ncbi:MAG TPA: hypothetical protein VGQ83_03875 [Polyangia bacterium]